MINRLTKSVNSVSDFILLLIAILSLYKQIRDLVYAFVETFGAGSANFGISIGDISIPGAPLGLAGIIYVSLVVILLARRQSETLGQKVLTYLPPLLLTMWTITYQRDNIWLIGLLIISNLWLTISYPRSVEKITWLRLFDYWEDISSKSASIHWEKIKLDLKAGMVWLPEFPKAVSVSTRCEFHYIEKESFILHRYLLLALLPTNSLILIGFMHNISTLVAWGIGIGIFFASTIALRLAVSRENAR